MNFFEEQLDTCPAIMFDEGINLIYTKNELDEFVTNTICELMGDTFSRRKADAKLESW
jgi:hypothetical protein